MSTQTNQRFVLDLLENGKIDTGEAEWLLETINDQPAHWQAAPFSPDRSNKVILEIDADQDNLQSVIKKLNQAIHTDKTQGQKRPFLQRLSRRSTPKAATR